MFSASELPVLLQFPEVRGKSEITERNPILATKPQVADAQNRGLVDRARFFTALLESPHGSMRQIPETPSTPPFSRGETAGRGVVASRCARQVLNLPHTSGFRLCGRPCPLISSAR